MSFIINNELWKVLYVNPTDSILLHPDGSIAAGVCDDYYKIIFLNSSLSNKSLKRVLCHEVTHAVMISYGIILPEIYEELFAELISALGQEIFDITNALFDQMKGGR